MNFTKNQPVNRLIIINVTRAFGIMAMLGIVNNIGATDLKKNINQQLRSCTPSYKIVNQSAVEQNSPENYLIKTSTLQDTTDKIFTFAEQMPVFPGGEAGQKKFILMNLRYPPESMKAGITGLVVAQFVVNKKGKIQDIRVVKSVNKELDEEVIRIIRSMPNFAPAKQNGQPVSFRYTLPVWFNLASNTPTNATLDTVNARIFTEAEIPPQFPGGEAALNAFIKKNLNYPEEAKKSKTEGLVVVQFLIDENGKLFYPKIKKSVNKILDAEAMRLIGSLPAFIPAKQNGKPVVFKYTLPVRFDL